MGITPSESVSHKDALDGLFTATQKYEERRDPKTGKIVIELVQDHKALKYKLQNIPSPYFGRYALILEKLFAKVSQAYTHMNPERADAAIKEIMGYYNSHQYSIDGKSSESRLNKLNRTANVLQILSSQKSEKTISFKEEMKQSILDGFRGKSKQEAID